MELRGKKAKIVHLRKGEEGRARVSEGEANTVLSMVRPGVGLPSLASKSARRIYVLVHAVKQAEKDLCSHFRSNT